MLKPTFPASALAALSMLFASSLCAEAHAYRVLPSYQGGHTRWMAPRIDMALSPEFVDLVGREVARSSATIACDAWHGYPDVPAIAIAEASAPAFDPDDEVNGIYVLRPWPYDPEHIALTFPRRTLRGEIISADIVLNGEVRWGLLPEDGDPPPGTHDVASILTHEVGHVLGLDESEVDGATMWPTTRLGETHKRLLSADDEAGVMFLYSTELPPEPATACSVGNRALGGRRGPGMVVGVWLTLLAVLRLRRPLLLTLGSAARARGSVVDATSALARSTTARSGRRPQIGSMRPPID